MSEKLFDLIVIGAGPGGYAAAFKAAQLGMKTALVESRENLGGTCLNVGCIPSKALLHSTEMLHFLQEKSAEHGIKANKVTVDLATMMKKKEAVVNQLRKGLRHLSDKKGVTVLQGVGSLAGQGKVQVKNGEQSESYQAKHILIATGSSVIELPFLKFDGKTIVSSDKAIALDKIPGKLVVVGAGAIGLELGSVWQRLGSEVTVVELLPRIVPNYDADVSKLAQRILQKQGMRFELGTQVTGTVKEGKKLFLTVKKDGGETKFEADVILVAVGRKPNISGLNAEAVELKLDDKGRIRVDDHYRTNLEGVYAIGDVIDGPMLAHKAEEEGIACVELIAGKGGHVNYGAIPNVVYTDPEIASVGMGEDEAKKRGIAVNIGKFAMMANGRAIASDGTDGFVKVIADAVTDKLLGVQILSKGASELIAAAVTHIEYGGSAEDLGRTIHAHPTLSESLKEAGLAVSKSSVHSL